MTTVIAFISAFIAVMSWRQSTQARREAARLAALLDVLAEASAPDVQASLAPIWRPTKPT